MGQLHSPLYAHIRPIQCVPIKRKLVLSVGYLHCHARFNQTICFIIKGIFSSFFNLLPNTWWYLNAWLKRNNLNSCMSKSICAEYWRWVDMTKFRLANPRQNKKSKQKKHDKRDKGNANECLFKTSLCSETWQTPLSLKFLFFANQFWHHHLKWLVLGHAGPIHLVTGVKRKKINGIL